MAVIQPIIDLAELCYQHGITQAVISPGSRSAAISLAFDKHQGISTHIVMDERAAAFIAIGMAQQLQKPVVLICTSGSAAYNFAPAVAEAFFQQIPLLILTADRPPEWIHQHDGQTIYQSGIFGKHVKKSFDFPADFSHPDSVWFANRLANEAIISTTDTVMGPVHINIPVREPFYPAKDDLFKSGEIRKVTRLSITPNLPTDDWHWIEDKLESYERIVIALGQMPTNKDLIESLKNLASNFGFVVLGDSISNLPNEEPFIVHHDLFLSYLNKEEFGPDLIITAGNSFISKSLKEFIRSNNHCDHWHIGVGSDMIDTFRHLTLQIPLHPSEFFNKLFEEFDFQQSLKHFQFDDDLGYQSLLLHNSLKSRRLLNDFLKKESEFTDLKILNEVLDFLPVNCQLHLANSMSVRYVNFLGVPSKGIEVFANRGTSGIDGCVSTAIGAALITSKDVYLIVGDVAFLYDRNGLLMNPLPANLKIILMNNAGGNIFRIIGGSSEQAELERLFETRHTFNCERTAIDSQLEYFKVESFKMLSENMSAFIGSKKASILEFITSPEQSANAFKQAKRYISSHSTEAD